MASLFQFFLLSVLTIFSFIILFSSLFGPSFLAIPLVIGKSQKKNWIVAIFFIVIYTSFFLASRTFFWIYTGFLAATTIWFMIFFKNKINFNVFKIGVVTLPLLFLGIFRLLHFDLSEKIVKLTKMSVTTGMQSLDPKMFNETVKQNLNYDVEQFIFVIKNYFTAIFYIVFFYLVVINFSLTRFWIALKLAPKKIKYKFDNSPIKLPFMFLWILLLSWTVVAVSLLTKQNFSFKISLNFALIFSSFYCLQGLAILLEFYNKIKLSNFLKFFLIFLLIEFLPFVSLILFVFAFGLFDEWFNFRKMKFTGGH